MGGGQSILNSSSSGTQNPGLLCWQSILAKDVENADGDDGDDDDGSLLIEVFIYRVCFLESVNFIIVRRSWKVDPHV